MTADPPVLLDIVDITDDVPLRDRGWYNQLEAFGEIVYIVRTRGWVSRLDVRQPRAPKRLPPQWLFGNHIRFQPMGPRIGAFSADGNVDAVLHLFEPRVDAPLDAVASWRAWSSRKVQRLQVDGDHLVIDQAAVWAHDVRDAKHPIRLGELSQADYPLFTQAARSLVVRWLRANVCSPFSRMVPRPFNSISPTPSRPCR